MRKSLKQKPKTKLEKALEADDAYKNPASCSPAIPRDAETVRLNKALLWRSMQTQPALAELARTDPVFQKLLADTCLFFGVQEVTLVDKERARVDKRGVSR